jgi:hypothetical protein
VESKDKATDLVEVQRRATKDRDAQQRLTIALDHISSKVEPKKP